jgi:murein DD-endopeptidase MepM/ murein hydrolase activator NlpD
VSEWFKDFMETLGGFFKKREEPRKKPTRLIVVESAKGEKKLRVLRPVPDKISSPFGGMRDLLGIKRTHNGIDFACPVGTEVRAVCDGLVFRAGYENDENHDQGYGLRVWQEAKIDGETYFVWYGHLSSVRVKTFDPIKEGQVIGLSGNTGRSTGPHLHLGMRKKDTSIYYDMEFYDWMPNEPKNGSKAV